MDHYFTAFNANILLLLMDHCGLVDFRWGPFKIPSWGPNRKSQKFIFKKKINLEWNALVGGL